MAAREISGRQTCRAWGPDRSRLRFGVEGFQYMSKHPESDAHAERRWIAQGRRTAKRYLARRGWPRPRIAWREWQEVFDQAKEAG